MIKFSYPEVDVLKKRNKMKRNTGKKICSFVLYIFGIVFICAGVVGVISLDNETFKDTKALNNNLNKTVSTKELVNSFQKLDKKTISPVMYSSFEDAVYNSKYYPTSFVGKLVHYGPDCPECGGHLGCNGQDARNGNIYYNDSEYGKLRIVAMSSNIPCGSIIRINVDAYDPDGMYAIVLDRGVSGNMVDLLKTSAKASSPVQTVNNVTFDIVRYGY